MKLNHLQQLYLFDYRAAKGNVSELSKRWGVTISEVQTSMADVARTLKLTGDDICEQLLKVKVE